MSYLIAEPRIVAAAAAEGGRNQFGREYGRRGRGRPDVCTGRGGRR